jgi:hypothetical protein
MKKLKFLLLAVLIITAFTAGCTQNTEVPEGNVPDINPNAEAANKDTTDVMLYFSYHGEDLLAGETRSIDVPISDTLEKAVVKALVDGPVSDELTGLFWQGVELVGIDENANHVFVTLSQEFITTEPEQELIDGMTADEQKKLAIYSIVNTIVEMGVYSRVQIYVANENGINQRITHKQAGWSDDNDYLDPLGRDSSLILTPENTIVQALTSFKNKDWSRLYTFTAKSDIDGTSKPLISDFSSALAKEGNVLESFEAIDSNVASSGQSAVVMINYSLKTREGTIIEEDNIPIILVREKNIWKLTYSSLVNLLINV